VLSSNTGKFPLYKRRLHQHQKNHTEELEPIFRALREYMLFAGLESLSRATHISESTLSSWRTKLRKTPDWRPSRRAYALPRRIFTDGQEEQLAERIKMRYLRENLFDCDEDFKLDALHFCGEIRSELKERAFDGPEAEKGLQTMPFFKASAPFIRDFRCRNRLALRRP
jgi:hypothetical protein